MKKYSTMIVVCASLLFPAISSANSSWALRQEGPNFSIQGECASNQVKIELFGSVQDFEPKHASKVDCRNGKFVYSDDFSGLDLPGGNYIVAIDGEKSQTIVAITKKENTENKKSIKSNDLEVKSETEKDVDSSEVKFLGAFASLQKSVLDMRTWLAQTQYPKIVKTSMEVALDGLDVAAGKVSDLILYSENTKVLDKDAVAQEQLPAERMEKQLAAENLQLLSQEHAAEKDDVILVEPQNDKSEQNSVESIVSADGLNISSSSMDASN